MCLGRKNICRTLSGDPARHGSTSRIPALVSRVEANAGTTLEGRPIEDSDRISSTNSEVESIMNHRRLKEAMRAPAFSEQEFTALSSVDAYIRATRDGLARVTQLFSKDIQVRVCAILMDISQ